MPSTGNVASDAHTLGSSTNNRLVILIRSRIDVVQLCTTAYSEGVATNDFSRAAKRELAFIVRDVVEMVCPYGERARRVGTAKVVVAGVLDVEANIVLAS